MITHIDSMGCSTKAFHTTGQNPNSQQLGAAEFPLFIPSACPQPWRQAQKTAKWHTPSVEQTCRSPARDWHWRACKKPPAHETALASVFIIYFNLLRADPNIWFLSAMYTEPSSVCKQLQNTAEIANRRFLGFPCTSWHTRWHTSLKNHQYTWTDLFL